MRGETPKSVSPTIKRFCERISSERPTYLTVEALPGAAQKNCFLIIDDKVKTGGGQTVIGWQIWEWPKVLVEAEFHAVWSAPDGFLHDLTPKPSGISRILFLPDPKHLYTGRQVDNVREPLSNADSVREFIRAHEAMFEFTNRGARANQHGSLSLHGADAVEYRQLQSAIARATQGLLTTVLRPSRNDPCPCGSGQKFKRCHGR